MRELTKKVIFALILNILASYYILPRIYGINNKYYNTNDFYLAVITGLVLLIIEMSIVFLYSLIFK